MRLVTEDYVFAILFQLCSWQDFLSDLSHSQTHFKTIRLMSSSEVINSRLSAFSGFAKLFSKNDTTESNI